MKKSIDSPVMGWGMLEEPQPSWIDSGSRNVQVVSNLKIKP